MIFDAHGHFDVQQFEDILIIKSSGSWNKETYEALHQLIMDYRHKNQIHDGFLQVMDLRQWEGSTSDGFKMNQENVLAEPVPRKKLYLSENQKVLISIIKHWAWPDSDPVQDNEKQFFNNMPQLAEHLTVELGYPETVVEKIFTFLDPR